MSLDSTVSRFIADAPPGELSNVIKDIEALEEENPQITSVVSKHVETYNINQFTLVELDNGKTTVISQFNKVGDKFFDPVLQKQFGYDHEAKKATNISFYSSDTDYDIDSLHSSLSQYIQEHYPSEVGFGVFPQPDSTIAIVIVDSRYSPQNFWNGRWRSWYLLDPASGRISGSIEIDVHYFEDGNVRLKTRKEIGVVDAKSPLVVVNRIAQAESKYQEDVNRAFVGLNENEFKALRRQLPVTRSKMNWGKAIGTYRLGKDIGGAN